MSPSPAPAPRNLTLDVAKGLGILLVVLGHNWIVLHEKGELFRLIFSFHMPLFFVVAGVFLRESQPLGEALRSRAGQLLKPYFAVLLAYVLLKGAAQVLLAGAPPAQALGLLVGVLYGSSGTLDWFTLWFLPQLFLASLVALLLLKAVRAPAARLALAAGLLALGVAGRDLFWQAGSVWPFALPLHVLPGLPGLPGLPWGLDLLPLTVPFLLLGRVLSQPIQQIRLQPGPAAAALIAFAALHALTDRTLDFSLRIYEGLGLVTAQALLGIYLLLLLARALQSAPRLAAALARLGAASLFVLIFHLVVQDKVFALGLRVLGEPGLAAPISLLAGLLLPLSMWEAVRRSRWLARLLLPAAAGPRPPAARPLAA